jgi:phosphatidylglycerol:prolipoprotein diacylglycerol transferase
VKPFLFEIGGLGIPTYGVMALLAYGAAVLVMIHYARRENLAPRTVVDGLTLAIAAGLVGARLLGVIVELRNIIAEPALLKTVIMANGVWLGGVIGAVGFGLWWFRKAEIPVLGGMDIFAMAGAMATAVSRWGCFFSGCCWGKPTDLPWGVTFPEIAHNLHPGLPYGPVHPTQIYQSLVGIGVFAILALVYRRKRFDGQIFLLYLILLSVTRFFMEYVRGDAERGFVVEGVLSTSQFIGILLLLVSLAAYVALLRRARVAEPA